MTPLELRRARRHLVRHDPVLAEVIRRIGPCTLATDGESDPFSSLLGAIVSQQLSSKAAATIHARLLAKVSEGRTPTPAQILATPDEDLRAVGLSRAKTAYVKDLASHFADARIPVDALHTLDDDAVIDALTEVKGIGRWSAEMFLIFRLKRPDVLPLDDVGIIRAAQRVYGLRRRPTPKMLTRIAAPWRPYRSIACWYLWAALDAPPNV